jgi:hypothetical protein
MALLNRFRKDGSTLTPLKGNRPTATLVKDVIGVNNTFSRGQYTEYILATKSAAELKRAPDLTGNP